MANKKQKLNNVEMMSNLLPAPIAKASLSGSSIALSWTNIQDASYYNVSRGSTSENLVQYQTNIVTTSFTDGSPLTGTNYYTVTPVLVSSPGNHSEIVFATPGGILPPAITGLSSLNGNNQIILNWTAGVVPPVVPPVFPPAPDSRAIGYNIYRSTTTGSEGTAPIAVVPGTTFTDTFLADSTVYFYKVAPFNINSEGTFSPEISGVSTISVFIPHGIRPPEFSIGVFDTATVDLNNNLITPFTFSSPRPIRYGVPVISTVPANDTSGTASASEKIMYFRVIANMAFNTTFNWSASTPVTLKIYFPGTLDTLIPPASIPLVYIGTLTATARPYYYGYYTFKQENAINTVDGYAFVQVFIPMRMQSALSMKLQVSSAAYTNQSPLELATLY